MVKIIALLLMSLMVPPASAQIVDTWEFSSPEQRRAALKIAAQLRCPQCQNQNLLESTAPAAVSMRHEVFSMIGQGKGETEIMAFMTQRYGDFVRYAPPLRLQTSVLWLTPPLLLSAIFAILWRVIRRQRGRKG
ncbi:heme lyase NrfEFG subunit NrfF [Brenneria corticis]|uniref:Formate-dependent nitrite reductase complex subunit n=1 Tax=Brenneria corticis TaxID=2173106 RepID=A0A2U1U474_9GAMM|nr:heme lyase NrfEFG subunit NrfF [Brenneria sp. CFCC 11842]PWC16468.1 heme lyase NrfEFG subunit NrfF [Brenneria sp. CFCC 11842]